MRDLNQSKLNLCHLRAVATACSKVYQVNILVVCSPSKANEDSQHKWRWGVPIVWPILVHLRVIVYQLAVQCKAQRCYESQSRQLKNEGEKNFPCRQITAMCLSALSSAVPGSLKKIASYRPHYPHPTFNIPRFGMCLVWLSKYPH